MMWVVTKSRQLALPLIPVPPTPFRRPTVEPIHDQLSPPAPHISAPKYKFSLRPHLPAPTEQHVSRLGTALRPAFHRPTTPPTPALHRPAFNPHPALPIRPALVLALAVALAVALAAVLTPPPPPAPRRRPAAKDTALVSRRGRSAARRRSA